ncbi:alpha/beta hydrolase family protein [Spirosoma sp. KUDC1026]|uniref:S9 family peptidase n=1 Tax=Spirosoma sp. KUDC1026 TaxID=2745947 RepID=UPI00159B98D1|nr:S9 family peptidase [Spirosoma sp. KUDC1026]QKZ15583.1 S9 family peptidase [Spirosoma sp. KUDC1026]
MLKRTTFLILLATQFGYAQTKSKVLVTDLLRLKQVGGIELSPDGKRAVYTLTTIEPNPDAKPEEYDYHTHIYLTNLKAGDTKALTHGAESARQAVWSPDGQHLAFVRSLKGKSQIFIMPLNGGEAWQLTNGKYSASNPVWSPDGKQIAFSSNVTMAEMMGDSILNPSKGGPAWSLEKPGFANNNFVKADKKTKANPDGSLAEIRAYLQKDVEDKKAKVINRLNFQGEFTTEPDPSFTHLYVISVQEGAKAKALTRGFTSFQAGNWLPDGKGLLAVTDRDSLKHPDREQDNAIVFIAADGSGKRSTVLAEEGKSYGSPELSPDGKQLAFQVSPSQGVNFAQVGLATFTGTGASGMQLVTFDRAASNVTWTSAPASGKGKKASTAYAIYFTASANGGVPLYRLDPATRQVTQLTDFTSGVTAFDVVGDQVVFAKTEVANPSELYAANAQAKGQIKLTNHNDWVAQRQLSLPEKRTYKNSIGQTVDYWIMKPTVVESNKKHPLLLNMHGGPTAMWGPGEASMWHEFQYMASQGYGIVYANPRGSGGYGINFQRANIKDWGTGPAEDVLAAATNAAKEAWVDTSRQVITGGSYAGYLTAWIVGHDNRFKAAFAQRGVYDLTTFMGEANAWRLVPNYFVYPWDADAKVLDANSPYSFVQNIKTPLLIKHGENDLRTGVAQSEMLYKSLKILNRPVEYVRMPGATHELSRTGNVRQRIDRLLRIYEFFERYVGPDAQGVTQK